MIRTLALVAAVSTNMVTALDLKMDGAPLAAVYEALGPAVIPRAAVTLAAREDATCFTDAPASTAFDQCTSAADSYYASVSSCDPYTGPQLTSCFCSYVTALWDCVAGYCPNVVTAALSTDDPISAARSKDAVCTDYLGGPASSSPATPTPSASIVESTSVPVVSSGPTATASAQSTTSVSGSPTVSATPKPTYVTADGGFSVIAHGLQGALLQLCLGFGALFVASAFL